jgi:hypothetical protein
VQGAPDSKSALPGCEYPDRKPPAIGANAPIVEQFGFGGFCTARDRNVRPKCGLVAVVTEVSLVLDDSKQLTVGYL